MTLKYPGAKTYQAKNIVELIPKHTHYAEPYCGALKVLLAKPYEGISETVNDINRGLFCFWQCLKIDIYFDEFSKIVNVTPFSEDEFKSAKFALEHAYYLDPQEVEIVKTGVDFFVANRMSRQGLMKDYATPTRRTRRGMNENVSAWLSAVDGLPELHERLKRVEIRNMDGVNFIQKYDHKNCLQYIDPPYLHSTRVTTNDYEFEMTNKDHERLLECLGGIKGLFLLSGYNNPLYTSYEKKYGWNRLDFEYTAHSSSKSTKDKRIESIWLNY